MNSQAEARREGNGLFPLSAPHFSKTFAGCQEDALLFSWIIKFVFGLFQAVHQWGSPDERKGRNFFKRHLKLSPSWFQIGFFSIEMHCLAPGAISWWQLVQCYDIMSWCPVTSLLCSPQNRVLFSNKGEPPHHMPSLGIEPRGRGPCLCHSYTFAYHTVVWDVLETSLESYN